VKQASNERIRFTARSRLRPLYIFLALFTLILGTSHSPAQVAVDAQNLALNTEIVASGSLAGAARAIDSLPLGANVIDQQSAIGFDPISWILFGLSMILFAYIGSRRMKRAPHVESR
jgi:disulfide bond formation protein DsbB